MQLYLALPFGDRWRSMDMVSQTETSHGDADRRAEQADLADYIARMTAELSGLAARADLSFLAYLLGMAEKEASEHGARKRSR